MNRRRQCPQTQDEGGGGSVQQFVANTIDAARLHSPRFLPATVADDLFQWNPVAGSAPGSDHHVWIVGRNRFRRPLGTRLTQKLTARGFHQFRNPLLRRNQRLTPFLAKNARTLLAADGANDL